MPSISEVYRTYLTKLINITSKYRKVTAKNVYQPGNLVNRAYVEKVIEDHLLPGSRIIGIENLYELHRLSKTGKSCLILMEHYSNFDLPVFIYLLGRSGPEGKETADSIIAMAGMKLNEESSAVLAFTEAYSRIVIYPSRYLEKISDPAKLKSALKRSKVINRAALHHMVRCKHAGHIILVFPSGTRYRPGNPDTKRGLKEIDSYIKAFDYMVLIGIGGNILRVHPTGEMEEDQLFKDTVIYKVSPVLECNTFRTQTRMRAPADADLKQFVVDEVMKELDRLHEEIEQVRKSLAS
ncbi:MAG TPA: 1-acyl-sn-glycerol-3-phosphate acyltransferase [Spirochaetales bacterium]|nr:1-acyl-sn-glycerol-3-phosphate acyltransferase [Spirochaetales bacterium]